MRTTFVAAAAVILSSASGETDQRSLQAVGQDLVSVGTVSPVCPSDTTKYLTSFAKQEAVRVPASPANSSEHWVNLHSSKAATLRLQAPMPPKEAIIDF